MANTRSTTRQGEAGEDAALSPGKPVQPKAPEGRDDSFYPEVQDLRNTVRRQGEIIRQLEARLDADVAVKSQRSDPMPRIKSPPVNCYSGKPSDRTSEKVKSFFYSIQKFGALYDYDDAKLVAFAECYLQVRAASWMMRLEKERNKPTTLEGLKKAMIAEFVPANEKAKARVRLMGFKSHQSTDLEEHIATFEDLITLCDTPVNEAYISFFNSLPLAYKAKFTEKFPTSQPLGPTGEPSIHVAYEYARILDLSRTVSDNRRESTGQKNDHGQNNKRDNRRRDRAQRPPHKNGSNSKKEWKDDSTVCWGSAQSGEGGIYRKYDRCCVCGLKGWCDPSHPCRKDNKGPKDKKGSETKKRIEPHDCAANDGRTTENLPILSALHKTEEEEGTYEALFEGRDVSAVVDSLASHNFMSIEAAKQMGLKITTAPSIDVELGNGSAAPIEGKTAGTLVLDGFESNEEVLLISMPHSPNTSKLILGRS